MAVCKGFGQQLRDARVSSGLTYGTVSRQLRIRVDILQAIEEEDFTTIPPRSYARGMVHAYASLLGLNAERITREYLEAAAMHDEKRAPRRRYQSSGVPTSLGQEVSSEDIDRLYQEDSRDAARERLRQRRERKNTQGNNSSGRDAQANQRAYRDSSTDRAQRGSRSQRDSSSRENDQRRNGHPSNRSRSNQASSSMLGAAGNVFARAADTVAGTVGGAFSQRKNIDINHSIYADSKRVKSFSHNKSHQNGSHVPKMHQSVMSASSYGIDERKIKTGKLPLIALGIVLLVLLVIGVNALSAKPASSPSTDTTATPGSSSVAISGLTDPGSAGTVEKETTVVPIAPTAAVFTYEIADGEDCYLEIYLDGASTPSVASTFTGPKKGTYDVTGTLSFVTSRPSVVTLKVDGKAVELNDENGDGVYVYNVDFREILDAWKRDNGQAD